MLFFMYIYCFPSVITQLLNEVTIHVDPTQPQTSKPTNAPKWQTLYHKLNPLNLAKASQKCQNINLGNVNWLVEGQKFFRIMLSSLTTPQRPKSIAGTDLQQQERGLVFGILGEM